MTCLNDCWYLQLRKKLVLSNIQVRYRLVRKAVVEAHLRECRIDTARLQADLHLSLKLLHIEPGGRWSSTPYRSPMAMDDLLFRPIAKDFVVDLVRIVCCQGDADLSAFDDRNWLSPNGVVQFQNHRFGTPWPRLLNCRARHLQISHTGEDFFDRVTVGTHAMIFQEEFVSRKSRAIPLLAQNRSIDVKQGMKNRGHGALGSRLLGRRGIDPIAISGKRICGQSNALRLDFAVQFVPVHIQALDPEINQFG